MLCKPIAHSLLHILASFRHEHSPKVLGIGPLLALHHDNHTPRRNSILRHPSKHHTTSTSSFHPISYSGHEDTTPERAFRSPSPQSITFLPAGSLKPWPFCANDGYPVFGIPNNNPFYAPLARPLSLAIAGAIIHQDGRLFFHSIQLLAVLFCSHTFHDVHIRRSDTCQFTLVWTPVVHI